MRLAKDKSTKEKREFWESVEKIASDMKDKPRNIPPLGDAWWKAETDISMSLLNWGN